MKVKDILSGILTVGLVGSLSTGCDGEKANPKTADKADLNPPGFLDTVTRDSKIELRWTAGNVEEDFKGYYVFALKKSDYDLKAKGLAKFPTKADPEKAGIPRCVDNSKWFEVFGLPATDAECNADEATPASGAKLTDDGTALDDSASGEKTEKLTGFVVCDETKVKEPSLVATPPVVTTQKCTVSKLADGTALANGTSYVFFAVAVAEDDLSKVSWTSNVVSDTPSKDSASESTVTLENNEPWAITISPSTGTANLATAATTCVTGACSALSLPNTSNSASPTIYLSRTSSTTGRFPQRLYISAPQTGTVTLQPRGPQTYDPLTGTKVSRIPGDRAADADSFPAAGTKYIVYNNQVFDFAVTESSKTYYGKVVIGDVTYADTSDATSKATLKVSVIFQPAAGVRDYFTSPELH